MSSDSRAIGAPKFILPKTFAAAALALTLAACGGAQNPQGLGPSQSPSTSQTNAPQEGAASTLTIADAWAKSALAGEEDAMTGIFGQIHNPTETAISIVTATTDVAHMVELHETVMDAKGNTVMQAVEAGFEIAPGGTLILEPGKEHVMLMGLTQDLIAGDQVEFALGLSDGNTLNVVAEIRDYKGAQETYSHEETEPTDLDGAEPDGPSEH